MKNIWLYLFLVILSCKAYSQINLVPNFSFEQYSICPSAADQVQYATGWSKCSNAGSTPDYYNACAPSSGLGVPKSYYIYQPAHRNCGAYMGLVTRTNNPNDREDISIQLSAPLTIGQKYFLSFYTVMGGAYDGTFYYESPSNNIGIRLSTNAYTPSSPAPIDNFAHLRSVAITSDTLNWVRVSGSIVADSTYNYLMLGNFYDDANTNTITLTCGACINLYSYCLIDDVCISSDSLLCNGGIDVLSCTVTTSVSEASSNNEVKIFPNPATDVLTISFGFTQNDIVSITDVYGNVLLTERVNNSNSMALGLSDFSTGMYFIKIRREKSKEIISKKIIKL